MCFLLTAFLVFILDQCSKRYIIFFLPPEKSSPVIENIFHLTLVKNRGAAFGLLPGYFPLLLIISLFTIFLILFFHFTKKIKGRLAEVSFGLILGGALGNLLDRLIHGAVIDFLDFRIWPVFNLADSAITIGVILLAWVYFKER